VKNDPEKVDDHKVRAITTMFATLRRARIRYAVLGAIGCGMFGHSAQVAAQLYAQENEKSENINHFKVIALAIYAAPGVMQGATGDNFSPCTEIFEKEINSTQL